MISTIFYVVSHHKTHANLQQHVFYFVYLHTGDVCGGMRAKIRRARVADSRVVCDESNNVETNIVEISIIFSNYHGTMNF